MVDFGNTSSKDRWVCPNDRHLALRAKLKTGWSVKTLSLQSFGTRQDSTLNDTEQQTIKEVIKRAEMLEVTEQERVGRLVQRLENIKKAAMGNGVNQCILCGDSFGVLGSSSLICHDCKKAVCPKCGIETLSAQKEAISLCKICSETREMWKKSGAWFFKGLPKYVLPEKKSNADSSSHTGSQKHQRPGLEKNSWSRASSGHLIGREEEESSSEDELSKRTHQAKGWQREGSESSCNKPSLRRQSSSIASDTNLGNTPSMLTMQYSEPLSAGSQGEAAPDVQASSDDKQDCSRSRINLDSNSTLNRQISSETQHIEQSVKPWVSTELTHNSTPYTHVRRDSQGSTMSREWCWSEDRASLSGSSISGHRTTSSGADITEDISDSAVPESAGNLGSLELSLLYDPIANALHCSIVRAKGLKPMDINGLSDPFCRLTLLPAGGKSNKLRTKTVHKTRNPEFNETLTFYGISEGEMAMKMLHILVLDDDKYGHDFMGEARIPLVHVIPQQPKYMDICLEKHFPAEEDDEVWSDGSWIRGQILVTLCYSTRKRALIVGIVRCVNLQPMDHNGFSDPFVKLRLKPDTFHHKYKTSIKWKNLNPIFNEEFTFETKMTDLPKQALEISVWDKDYGKSNDYLGGLQLSWHSKGERLKHWIDMIKFPDHKHEGWHNLGEETFPE